MNLPIRKIIEVPVEKVLQICARKAKIQRKVLVTEFMSKK